MNNQKCKTRSQLVNTNKDDPVFFPLSIKINKCSGSYNDINNLHAKLSVPDVVKNLNVNVFNLISRTNKKRHIKWLEAYKCRCRLDASICNNKQCCNEDKCKCKCKELIDEGVCDKGPIRNPSNCECECDKSCDVGEYLDYKNGRCKKRFVDKLVDQLVDECTENGEEVKLVKITSIELHSAKNENACKCSSCILYIVLLLIVFTINSGISS